MENYLCRNLKKIIGNLVIKIPADQLELIWVKSDLIEEFLTNSLILAGVYPHYLAFGIIYGTISVLFNNTVFLKF